MKATYLAWLAVRNSMRNRRRSLLTLSAVLIVVAAIAFGQSWMSGIVGSIIESYVRLRAGHVRILHRDYAKKERILPVDLTVEGASDLAARLERLGGITGVAPRIRFGGLLRAGERAAFGAGLGVVPDAERNVMRLDDFVVEGRPLRQGEKGILVGAGLAEILGVSCGETVTVMTRTRQGLPSMMELEVVGLVSSGVGRQDRRSFFVTLPRAQELTGLGDEATEVVVMVADPSRSREAAREIASVLEGMGARDRYAVLPWQGEGGFASAVGSVIATVGIITGILFFVGGLTIFNTMLMSVFERTREIGMMRALGLRPRGVIALFLLESLVIAGVGGVCGAAVGSGVALYLEAEGLHLGGAMENLSLPIGDLFHPRWSLRHPLYAFLFGLAMALAAALYPALRASRLAPSESLRAI
jgi:putative ABC transport system permease protein